MQQACNKYEAKESEPIAPIRCLSQALFLDPLKIIVLLNRKRLLSVD